MLTFSDVTFEGPGINFADNDIPDILIRRPIITTRYTANATFVVPAFCESISVATVGGGGGGAVGISGTPYGGAGGGGGGLSYRNNIKVTPGETLTIVIGLGGIGGVGGVSGSTPTEANYGADGGTSYIQRSTGEIFVIATGGTGGTINTSTGQGGGLPGVGGSSFGAVGSQGGRGGGVAQSGTVAFPGGGGGAGGFGGNGGNGSPGVGITSAIGGAFGGGGGGGYGYAAIGTFAGNGGGVDLAANIYTASLTNGIPGTQGQGGTQGSDAYGSPDLTTTFGGGGAGAMGGTGFGLGRARSGGDGGLLLLSPGNFRTFPRPTESQIPNYDTITTPIINVNYSADFRSMTSSIYLNDSEATNLTNTNTIEFWMFMSIARPNVNVCILSPGNTGAAGLFVTIGGASGNQLRIGPTWQNPSVSDRSAMFVNNATIPTGAWTHVVLQYNAGRLTVYINGIYRTYGTANGLLGLATSTATSLTVGNYAGGGNFNFNGLISNLRLTKGKMLYPTSGPATERTFAPPTAPYNLTTNGSTPAGYGALTNPLETEVRSLAFSTSNVTEDKSIFTAGIGTWVPNGQVPVSTLSPF